MNTFLTRVELHDANETHYAALHAAMEKQKFQRVLVDSGIKYQLPTAEYISYSSVLNAEGVRNLAKQAANTTNRASWIITVQSAGMAWELPILK